MQLLSAFLRSLKLFFFIAKLRWRIYLLDLYSYKLYLHYVFKYCSRSIYIFSVSTQISIFQRVSFLRLALLLFSRFSPEKAEILLSFYTFFLLNPLLSAKELELFLRSSTCTLQRPFLKKVTNAKEFLDIALVESLSLPERIWFELDKPIAFYKSLLVTNNSTQEVLENLSLIYEYFKSPAGQKILDNYGIILFSDRTILFVLAPPKIKFIL